VVTWLVLLAGLGLLLHGGVLGLMSVRTELWGGLPLTILLSVVGIGLSLPLAVLLALGRRSHMPLIRAVSVGYIELVRGVPLISILFMASVMFPLFLPEGVTIDKLLRAQVGIILFSAAYLAEVVRGGLQAIPAGQYEAADALGLGYWRKMRLVILPQALKLVIPPMVNSFIATFKDTSLVIIIGLYDLLGATRTATNDPVWRAFTTEGYLFVAAIFFVFCSFMSRYSRRLEAVRAPTQRPDSR
jgi:general L-amino acid transport system permease protein